jgi:Protein of unknown function (DUF2877)
MSALAEPVQKIAGFESTAYALQRGRVVWVGAAARHPRCLHQPWRPGTLHVDPVRLRTGAAACLARLELLPLKGLLLWLAGRRLPFPLDTAAPRFDAIRDALERNHPGDFEAAAYRVLGLGHGLTPSGDDFLGGILFALHHAPRAGWGDATRTLRDSIRRAALTRTNVISAALLDDLMAGASHAELHELLAALHTNSARDIETACLALLRLGASSGADLLAGVLVALTTSVASSAPAS